MSLRASYRCPPRLRPTIVVESNRMGKVLSIGEAAKLAGVSVQTLRHYDKLGLLAPSHVSAAGYRRYSERDCERLRLIRALREVGFDLDTIGQLLASKIGPDDAIRMRFEALEAEQRALRRRQLLLRAAINGKRKNVLARLQQKYVLAKLDRFERESFLERHFNGLLMTRLRAWRFGALPSSIFPNRWTMFSLKPGWSLPRLPRMNVSTEP